MIYVYAFVDRAPRGAIRGLAGERVRFARRASARIAWGRVEAPPEASTEMLRAHDATVRALASACRAVLPARFGGALADLQDLSPSDERLSEALELVRGREQMTLRVFGEARAPVRARTGTEYLARRALPELAPVRKRLDELVVAERIERHERPPLLASVFHLVERGRSEDYCALVARSRAKLELRASGPFPCYAFASEVSA